MEALSAYMRFPAMRESICCFLTLVAKVLQLRQMQQRIHAAVFGGLGIISRADRRRKKQKKQKVEATERQPKSSQHEETNSIASRSETTGGGDAQRSIGRASLPDD